MASMPLGAELRLHTPLRGVIHPQFEDRGLRDRVQDIYKFYQCTPVDVFLETMRKFGAAYVVIEYKRCDFSPFKLDDRPDLNCAKEDGRPWSELFCPRAHLSPLLELLFANAGFAVLRLKDEVAPRETRSKPRKLEDLAVWKPMLDRCLREDPEACPGRVAELASMFHSKLKQRAVASTLFKWVQKEAPKDGLAWYVMARHQDYHLGNQDMAGASYIKAHELVPNNPVVAMEAIVWLDVVSKDNRTLERLFRPRRFSRDSRLSLVDIGHAGLACEASVTALQLFRDLNWAEELWNLALREGLGSECVKTNWPIHNERKEMHVKVGPWEIFLNVFWRRRMRSHLNSASSTGARWTGRSRPWQIGLAVGSNASNVAL